MLRSFAILGAMFGLLFGAGCSDRPAPEPEAKADFGAELNTLGERLGGILHLRKEIRDTPFFQGTDVEDELATMGVRLDACVLNVQRLAAYDEEADRQGLPEADRLRFKEADLRALREHLDHWETCFRRFDGMRDENGDLLFANHAKVLYSNQVLNELIAAEIPCYEDQTLMRDLSQRMLDSRRYWCQELANGLRGLEPDPEVMTLAVGTARGLGDEIGPVHERMKAASADFHRLTNGRNALAERLTWSRQTLAEQADDADFRRRAAAALDAIAPEIEALDARAAAELRRILEIDPKAYERRDALVEEQSALLQRLNAIVLVEAQKRGWPLPG